MAKTKDLRKKSVDLMDFRNAERLPPSGLMQNSIQSSSWGQRQHSWN